MRHSTWEDEPGPCLKCPRTERELADAQAEVKFFELALRLQTEHLNDLISACIGPDGKPVAPPYKTLMQMRGYLPSKYSNSLSKSKPD